MYKYEISSPQNNDSTKLLISVRAVDKSLAGITNVVLIIFCASYVIFTHIYIIIYAYIYLCIYIYTHNQRAAARIKLAQGRPKHPNRISGEPSSI